MNSMDEFVAAIQAGDSAQVSAFCANGQIDLNGTIVKGMWVRTVPLVLAASLGHTAIVEALLNAGASIEGVDEGGETACHAAVRGDHVAVVRLLMSRGADISVLDYRALSALHLAAMVGSEEIALLMIESNTELVKSCRRGTLCALASMSPVVIRALVDHGVPISQARDASGRPVLHCALQAHADHECAVVLDALVNIAGVDIDSVDINRRTCVSLCAAKNFPQSLRVLICCGADVNIADKKTRSPLHFADSHDDPQCSHLLLAAGANVRAKNSAGRTPTTSATSAQIAAVQLSFVCDRALQVCIGLHSLELDALQMCEILAHACGPVARAVPFHLWWRIATLAKHFHQPSKNGE